MDIVERLTLEAAEADTTLAGEYRHRYEFAAPLCAGRRVLDICCGTGHGSRILGERAQLVVGVDQHAAAVDTAAVTVGRELDNVAFQAAEVSEFLAGELIAQFDVIVWLDGLDRVSELDRALRRLRERVESGLALIISLPSRPLGGGGRSPEFDYDAALRALDGFEPAVRLTQFRTEGSLICPSGATETDLAVGLDGSDQREAASHLLFLVGFDGEAIARAHRDRIQLSTSLVPASRAASLEHTVASLRRENARLARSRLGKGGSAAASLLHRYAVQEARIAESERRLAEQAREMEALQAGLATRAPAGADRALRISSATRAVGRIATVKPQPVPVAAGGDPNTWEHRRRRAAEVLIPWIEQTIPLAGKTVLEYGCGNAAVSCAVGARAGRLIGLDIDQSWITEGRAQLVAHGLDNVELEVHPVASILEAFAARRGEIDVVLLYAVLEHLTIEERLQVLRLSREVVRADGAIVVCEAPNRLIYFDHHTAKMPFFGLLPNDLAARYYEHSNREDFKGALREAQAQGPAALAEAITRWGRGVSYHEFELVFGDLSRHVIASNYDPLLFGERPIQPDESMLSRYFERWRPDLAPVWSRYWLDLILSPEPIATRAPFLKPWSADTLESEGAAWTREECVRLRGADAILWVTLPHATRRVVIGSVHRDGREFGLYLRPEELADPLVAHIDAAAGPAFTTFELPGPASRFAIAASEACELLFIGYDC